MTAAERLNRKAHDYEVLAASHSEHEALVGGRVSLSTQNELSNLELLCARCRGGCHRGS